MAHSVDACILLGDFVVDLFVVKAFVRWTDIVLLTHFKVLTEVLVTAPPVGIDHAESLVAADLVEVGVTNIILNAIGWVTDLAVCWAVVLINLSDSVAPVGSHVLLFVFNHNVQKEGVVQVVEEADPH